MSRPSTPVRDRQISEKTVRRQQRAKPRFITIALIKHLLEEIQDPRFVPATDEKKGQAKSAKAAREVRKRVDFIVDTLCTLAMNGDTTAIKMIMDRVEGSAIQTMQFRAADLEENETTPEQQVAIQRTHDKIKTLEVSELRALYHATIASASLDEGTRTQGSA